MKFCSACGATVTHRIPEGDHLARHICDRCATIHYENPKIVTGCITHWQGKILLCRRAIEPRYGLWTLPAGFMENGETSAQGAARETREEANAVVTDMQLYGVFNLPYIDQIYLMYRGTLQHGEASPGIESLEVGLFGEAEIPWDALAFSVVRETLRLYLADRRTGQFPVHVGDVVRHADGSVALRHQ